MSVVAAAQSAAGQPLPKPVLGPDATRCTTDGAPAFLVQIAGLKNRQGTVRIRLFGGSPDTYFLREKALTRIQIPTPPTGPINICVGAPAPGLYAIDVRHDVNGDDSTDRSDGGGASGNPQMSMWSILLKKRPPAAVVQVEAGRGVKLVPITMMYMRGGRLRPIDG